MAAKKLETKSKEIESLILEIAKTEKSPAKIGLILRDKHGIPRAKQAGVKISQVLLDNKIQINDENTVLKNKVQRIEEHISKNKHDYKAKKALIKKIWIRNKN